MFFYVSQKIYKYRSEFTLQFQPLYPTLGRHYPQKCVGYQKLGRNPIRTWNHIAYYAIQLGWGHWSMGGQSRTGWNVKFWSAHSLLKLYLEFNRFFIYSKDVRLPVQLQRAMAAEAEAAREARAKVIAAEGEQKASHALKEAAAVIQESPSALQVNLSYDVCTPHTNFGTFFHWNMPKM